MKQIHYRLTHSIIAASRGVAYANGDDVAEAVASAVVDEISTDVEITAGGVTMHLAAWLNPDHWESDWQEALDGSSFEEYVAGLGAEE